MIKRMKEIRLDCEKKQQEVADFMGIKRSTYPAGRGCQRGAAGGNCRLRVRTPQGAGLPRPDGP